MSGSSDYVPDELRRRVSEQARFRCGYCLRSAALLGMPLTIDHILPQALGGETVEENLWLACHRCNGFKATQTNAVDNITGENSALYDPRTQDWAEHFMWSADGVQMIGKTPTGRATVEALKMNNDEIVVTRRHWVSAGWWPPQD